MKIKTAIENTGAFFRKIFSRAGKRGAIIASCVLLVAAAVFLNVVLRRAAKEAESTPTPANASLSGAETVDADTTEAAGEQGYFAEVVLSREKARDEAIEVLSGVISGEGAAEEMKQDARAQIERIARDMENEANIETLVRSKGLGDCVAVISGDKANVVVRIDGMTDAQVSQISEIVYEQSGIIPANLKIINN